MCIFDDPCSTLDCGPYGDCVNGACVCVHGYTGQNCAMGPLVDGGYSDWSEWSDCSASCGGGSQVKVRTCTNPSPRNGGIDCKVLGESQIERSCNPEPCDGPIDGGYTDWSEWTTCSNSCPQDGTGGFYRGDDIHILVDTHIMIYDSVSVTEYVSNVYFSTRLANYKFLPLDNTAFISLV